VSYRARPTERLRRERPNARAEVRLWDSSNPCARPADTAVPPTAATVSRLEPSSKPCTGCRSTVPTGWALSSYLCKMAGFDPPPELIPLGGPMPLPLAAA